MHTFVVDDKDHPQMIKICTELCQGSCLIEDICHILNYCCMMWKKKRCFICHHAEKLAIAFRLISRTSGTPL